MEVRREKHKGMEQVRRYPYRMGISMGLLVVLAMVLIGGYGLPFVIFLGAVTGIGTALVLTSGRRPGPDGEETDGEDRPES
ncbi:MAG: hypothetical protein HQL33_07285 [Alphaproteobacteria bacterium]|nr:hypothetical protein [Alphaproteobacteria bacterium]